MRPPLPHLPVWRERWVILRSGGRVEDSPEPGELDLPLPRRIDVHARGVPLHAGLVLNYRHDRATGLVQIFTMRSRGHVVVQAGRIALVPLGATRSEVTLSAQSRVWEYVIQRWTGLRGAEYDTWLTLRRAHGEALTTPGLMRAACEVMRDHPVPAPIPRRSPRAPQENHDRP